MAPVSASTKSSYRRSIRRPRSLTPSETCKRRAPTRSVCRTKPAPTPSKVVPEARGEAERILQAARAYKEQTVAEATGQTARFLKVYEEYKKAPEVTRKRMYLETMERVLSGADKIILDNNGDQRIVPYLSLDQPRKP